MQQLGKDKRPVVAVLDAMSLRRAGMAGLLRGWAEANQVSVTLASPDAPRPSGGVEQPVALTILNLGGASVGEPGQLEGLRALLAALPGTPVVIVSDRDCADEVVLAFRAGVRGFVPTTTEPEVALQAFSFIMGGGSFFPPAALAGRAPARPPPAANGRGRDGAGARPAVPGTGLTARQCDVLAHLREGRSNKAIARLLRMQESTAKVHVRQILRKLGAANRTQAALSAPAVFPVVAADRAPGPQAPPREGGVRLPAALMAARLEGAGPALRGDPRPG